MKALSFVFLSTWSRRWQALLTGLLLAFSVLSAGTALLGLSGWFITASGGAGLAGLGVAFDVFRPSAGIRFLAFGRAAARYGERLATHDAMLLGLAQLRVKLLGAILNRPYAALQRLRGSERLNLLTIDVDALDGLTLRLVLPALAAILSLTVTAVLVGWLTLPSIAIAQGVSLAVGVLAAVAVTLRGARAPSRMAQRSMQALRMRIIDMMRGQAELATCGRLEDQRQAIMAAQNRLQKAQAKTDKVDRHATALIGIFSSLAAALSLWLGAAGVLDHRLDAPKAALGFFVALALFEVAAPLARGLGELGKMTDAARRVHRELLPPALHHREERSGKFMPGPGAALALDGIGYKIDGRPILCDFHLEIAAGETVALTGASGRGKTTILNIARGLIVPESGTARAFGARLDILSNEILASLIGYLPQRTALVSGSVADNLRLAAPNAADDELWEALGIACIDNLVRQRGGLSALVGEAGGGLSGGEKRRLALARAILPKPRILLLDEPTEGLDGPLARAVLDNIRTALPHVAIIVAAHRAEEQLWAGRIVALD